MFIEPTLKNLQFLLALWVALLGLLAMLTWRSRRPTVGLPLIYAFSLTMVHFYGAIPYAVSTYAPTHQMVLQGGNSLKSTFLGFELANIGLAGVVTGWFVANQFASDKFRLRLRRMTPVIRERMPKFLLTLAFGFFFVFAPIMRLVPSLGSMGNAGVCLAVIAAALGCWKAWERGDKKLLLWWVLGSSVAFPFMTLVFMGFMSYGTAAVIMLWLFVYSFYRPRWLSTAVLLILTYGGMSVYVNYMASREAIRRSVWGQEAVVSRIEAVGRMFKNFEFLNTSNNNHLELIDLRLNQNYLVGACETFMTHSSLGFAHGSTLAVAAVSWIPRIIWPDKPKTGGSGALVANYTGISFTGGTSVGVGQVMEFYINWGVSGVFLGFCVFGAILRYCDIRAGQHLRSGDYWSFTRWFLPSLGLMQAIGNLAEIVGTVSAGAVFVTILHKAYFESYYINTRAKQKPEAAAEESWEPPHLPSFRVRK